MTRVSQLEDEEGILQGDREREGAPSLSTWCLLGLRKCFAFPSERETSLPGSMGLPQTVRLPGFGPRPSGDCCCTVHVLGSCACRLHESRASFSSRSAWSKVGGKRRVGQPAMTPVPVLNHLAGRKGGSILRAESRSDSGSAHEGPGCKRSRAICLPVKFSLSARVGASRACRGSRSASSVSCASERIEGVRRRAEARCPWRSAGVFSDRAADPLDAWRLGRR